MDLLIGYENSFIGTAVRETTWVYPWVNAFHAIGMGFLVGVLTMIVVRVLGFGQFSIAGLRSFVRVVQFAIAVNVASGLALFAGDAQRFFFSPTFRVKALFLVLAGITAWMLVRRVYGEDADWVKAGEAPRSVKAIAGITLFCWLGAIFAGRMTAYLP
jgi:hypothetical protein